MPVDLLDLAHVRLSTLLAEEPADPGTEPSTLDSVMRRLFDPRERDVLTVSAFQSSL
ncbi:hypothetical protein ACQP1P_38675 [Dactylosporangium sp. CA-052675]|uniref:hypothetical protein n=1 Tax=Dactylosporangium sp. CA-052675 TaxID=3239927 RepID=UPI003D8CACE5